MFDTLSPLPLWLFIALAILVGAVAGGVTAYNLSHRGISRRAGLAAITLACLIIAIAGALRHDLISAKAALGLRSPEGLPARTDALRPRVGLAAARQRWLAMSEQDRLIWRAQMFGLLAALALAGAIPTFFLVTRSDPSAR